MLIQVEDKALPVSHRTRGALDGAQVLPAQGQISMAAGASGPSGAFVAGVAGDGAAAGRTVKAGKEGRAGKAVKVGRNDPCPCGSGKKYKKCCGFNESEAETNE